MKHSDANCISATRRSKSMAIRDWPKRLIQAILVSTPLRRWSPLHRRHRARPWYRDHRERARGVIKRTLGIAHEKKQLRAPGDDRTTVNSRLRNLPPFRNCNYEFSSLQSKLRLRARAINLQPVGIARSSFRNLYTNSAREQRDGFKNSARLMNRLQFEEASSAEVPNYFPKPIRARPVVWNGMER